MPITGALPVPAGSTLDRALQRRHLDVVAAGGVTEAVPTEQAPQGHQ